ncbi:MAG: hypothetical protein EGW04_02705 [Rothia mucilaginosa]|nr:hypothetical protein [Rothia mucilaginosa]
MSRDDESPKYELNMTDYDEERLGVLLVELSAGSWALGIYRRYVCLIFLDTHEYMCFEFH